MLACVATVMFAVAWCAKNDANSNLNAVACLVFLSVQLCLYQTSFFWLSWLPLIPCLVLGGLELVS